MAQLDTVTFTIDQLTGRIFNSDSLPYGTNVEKVLCTITAASSYSLSGIEVSPEALGDSTYYMSSLSDSIDFSKPVKFVVHSYDDLTTKVYEAWVNIHQVEPDSMVWSRYASPMIDMDIAEQKVMPFGYAGEESYLMYVKPSTSGAGYLLYRASVDEPDGWTPLTLTGLPSDGLMLAGMTEYADTLYICATDGKLYRSADGLAWETLTDAPSVSYLLGIVKAGSRQTECLSAVADKGGTPTFYALGETGVWTEGDAVSDGFPVSGFGSVNYEAMHHQYLMIAGGRDAADNLLGDTWATMNGLSWARISSDEQSFTEREGAMVAYYDDKIYLIGGVDAANQGLKDIYQSIDRGVSWSLQDSLVTLPADYAGRGFSSIVVDGENRVNLFGGKTSRTGSDLNELWRGRIFRLVPKE